MNLNDVLESMAMKRPIFHNEADFQHALAWELRERYDCKIRLEKRMDIDPHKRSYLDIWIEHDERRIAIEVKYKMRAVEYIYEGETFSLLNQGAQDIGRYDVLKDLQRLEQMVKYQLVDEGHLIFLTNDLSYSRDPGMEKTTADRDFRIHEGRVISGTLAWHENTGAGTMKGREEPIVLEGTYKLSWQEYSRLDTSGGEIKALTVSVTPDHVKVCKPEEVAPEPVLRSLSGERGQTDQIRQYIRNRLINAKAQGNVHLELVSGDIHKAMNLSNRMPSVCQAMISVDGYVFEILHDTPSGHSSTKRVKYLL
jgi:hypothetical protein